MKQRTKRILKMLSIILIILILFEFVFTPRVSFATDETEGVNPVDAVLGVVDGIVGIFLNLFNIIPILLGGIIQGIASAVANIGGGRIWFLNNGGHII